MLNKILLDLTPYNGRLVAVTKTRTLDVIMELYNNGQRIFGENRVQELVEKEATLPKDIEWHMIGHLQSKKVKNIASFVDCIHSIDSVKLLKVVNKEASKHDRTIDVLLQFKIAEEESKYGFELETAKSFLNSDLFDELKNVRICGVMGMATFTNDETQVRQEFKNLKSIFDQLKKEHFEVDSNFKEISMGMSGDYLIALEEGSTMVRVGSLLFN